MDAYCVPSISDGDFVVPQLGELAEATESEASTLLLFGSFAEEDSALSIEATPQADTSSLGPSLSYAPVVELAAVTSKAAAPAPQPLGAPLPIGGGGLMLKLDYSAVLSAWQYAGAGHPFALQGAALESAAAAIPSPADVAASISPPSDDELCASGLVSAATSAATAPPAAAAAAALPRVRDRRNERRNRNGRRVRYESRRVNADKRPRIKGRFVSRVELEAMQSHGLVAGGAADRVVPAHVAAC
eukprot:scaffold12.g7986.t1